MTTLHKIEEMLEDGQLQRPARKTKQLPNYFDMLDGTANRRTVAANDPASKKRDRHSGKRKPKTS